MTNKLMIDCETLDIGECPIILSIGAVVFNDSSLVASLHVKISKSSCEAIGCTASEDTQKWWQQQSEEAREAAFGGTTDINEAMLDLIQVYQEYGCCEIWSRGSLADIRWINNILDKLEIKKPWKYYQEMCFRTLLKMAPEMIPAFSGTKHNALDDAINQAKQLIYINQHHAKQAQAIKEMGNMIADVQKLGFESKDQKGIFLTEAKATEITEALIKAYANIQIHSDHERKLINTLNRLSDEMYHSIKGKQND